MIMPPGLRKFALATHLTVSVGWVGAVGGYLALDVSVATSQDPQIVRAAWIAMDVVVSWAIVPLAVGSLLTGLVMALGTKWGLFRHWWVLVSLVLTVVAIRVLLSEADVIGHMAATAANPATSDAELLALPPTLVHSVGGLLVLLVIQVLNVYKPQGMTRYGWRKQQEQRRAMQRRDEGEHRRARSRTPPRGADSRGAHGWA
jgi:hypothetical protein